MGHHLRPSWSWQSRLPFPEAATAPQNEHLLPVSSLLLQRMLVAGPEVALSFQDGQSPWLYPVNGAQWSKVTAKGRIRCVGRAPLPHPVSLHHTHTSLCSFLDSFSHVKKGMPLLPGA